MLTLHRCTILSVWVIRYDIAPIVVVRNLTVCAYSNHESFLLPARSIQDEEKMQEREALLSFWGCKRKR